MKVSVPERLGRRMSVGPFEDPRDFLRFMVFASVGALLSIAFGLPWGLPVLAVGALLTLIRSDEETLFAHAARRLAYYASGRSPPGVGGNFTSTGWQDRYGRMWRFYTRDPFRIHGREEGEVHGTSLELVRALSDAEGEVILVRTSEPWDVGPYLPPRTGRESPDVAQYRSLLGDSVKDLYRARLVLGLSGVGPGPARAQLPEGDQGWTPLMGRELKRSFMRGFPFGALDARPAHETPGTPR